VLGSIDIHSTKTGWCWAEPPPSHSSHHETSNPQHCCLGCHELNIHRIRRRFLFTCAELVVAMVAVRICHGLVALPRNTSGCKSFLSRPIKVAFSPIVPFTSFARFNSTNSTKMLIVLKLIAYCVLPPTSRLGSTFSRICLMCVRLSIYYLYASSNIWKPSPWNCILVYILQNIQVIFGYRGHGSKSKSSE